MLRLKSLFLIFCWPLLALPNFASADSLQFWKFSGGQLEDAQIKTFCEEWSNEHPDKAVEVRFFSQKDYVAGPVLTTAFASGNGPDIFWISPGLFLQYARSGLAADLSDLFSPEVREDFLPASIDAVTLDGKIYACPIEQEPVALYYNRDLIKKANVEVPKTWDELLAACEKLKAAHIIPIVIETAPGVYQNFTWYPFLWQTGADVMNKDFTEGTFDSPGAAKALDLWRTLIQKGYAPRVGAPDVTAAVNTTAFGSNRAAMQVVGVWAITMMNEAKKVNYGIAPLPTPDGANPVTVYGGWTQMVNAKSKNLAAAKEFSAWLWLQGTERPVAWTTKAKSNFSPRKSVVKAVGAFYDEEHLKVFRDDILPTAHAEPRYPAEVVKIVSDALQSAMFKDSTGATAAANAQKLIKQYLDSKKQ